MSTTEVNRGVSATPGHTQPMHASEQLRNGHLHFSRDAHAGENIHVFLALSATAKVENDKVVRVVVSNRTARGRNP